MSKEEVAKLVVPHTDTLELVHSWLAHHNVPLSSISMTHDGAWLTLTGMPVSQVNELLDASYQRYRHVGKEDSAVLHAHVQAVAPTTVTVKAERMLGRVGNTQVEGHTLRLGIARVISL